jgi:hypothetical protein
MPQVYARARDASTMQALAIALYGDEVDFGLTLEQAMEPNPTIGTVPECLIPIAYGGAGMLAFRRS